ncbi:MAG: M14 family zinc carboxypeptidase [Candidatus Alcyoniella australis]|nr:M14 family zinc carboxypeptidase [Candidatus Alcyoniella australis]
MRRKRASALTLAISSALAVLLACTVVAAQDEIRDYANESYCLILTQDRAERDALTHMGLIVDGADEFGLKAFLNPQEIDELEALGYEIEVLQTPQQLSSPKPDGYYDYSSMAALLGNLADGYPALTQLFSIGQSVDGRELWVIKISDNADTNEPEPEVWFDGGIHGDEWSSFEAVINLANHLLSTYDSDASVQQLVDGFEIYIMPMLNPDGCTASTRYNSHGKDLNRSFPIFYEGSGVGGSEPELQAVTEFFLEHALTFGANYHSGAETINYPMDSQPQLAPDDTTLSGLASVYGSAASYPITNGYDWYEVQGISEETYYLAGGAMAFIVEVSSTKTPSYSQIPSYNARNLSGQLALLDVLDQGLSGTVVDAASGAPLFAMLRIAQEGWAFYSDSDLGDFHRYIRAGDWTVVAWANGYAPATSSAQVFDGSKEELSFELVPAATPEYYAMRVIANDRADGWTHANPSMPLTALGAPDGYAYSIGNDGYVVLDMGLGTPIVDSAGADVQIVESGSDPEGAAIFVAEHWLGPWQVIGVADGTTDLDISPSGLSEARYIKIEDDGSGGSGATPGFDLDAVVVTVPCEAPVVDFSADVTQGAAPLSVNFSSAIDVLPGCLLGQYWEFGDGGSSTENSPTYIFNTPGIYTVSLTGLGVAGENVETKADYIVITGGDDDDDDDDSAGDDDDDDACCG